MLVGIASAVVLAVLFAAAVLLRARRARMRSALEMREHVRKVCQV